MPCGQNARGDAQALTHELADVLFREALFDIFLCRLPACLGQLAIFEELTHDVRGLVKPRLGPHLPCTVGSHILGQLDEVIADQEAVLGCHEVGVARPAGRDRRLALGHGFGHQQPEALRAVQRKGHVARGHEVAHLLRAPVASVDRDRLAGRVALQGLESRRDPCAR